MTENLIPGPGDVVLPAASPTGDVVPTQPVPQALAVAFEAMLAVLAGDPEDFEVFHGLHHALDVLTDVRPLYPPLPEPSRVLRGAEGVAEAVQALRAAAGTVPDPWHGLRIALVVRDLQDQLNGLTPSYRADLGDDPSIEWEQWPGDQTGDETGPSDPVPNRPTGWPAPGRGDPPSRASTT